MSKHRNFYKDYLTSLENKIYKIAFNIFSTIKRDALARNVTSCSLQKFVFHHPVTSILKNILEEKYQIETIWEKRRIPNDGDALEPTLKGSILNPNVLFSYKIKCVWSPLNPHIYRNAISEKEKPVISTDQVLEDLFNNKNFAEMTLIAEGKIFKVHKAILDLHKVFNLLLHSGMEEEQTDTIQFREISARVLDNFVRSLYAQPLSFNPEEDIDTLVGLLQCAHLYGFQKLFDLCTYHLENWSEKNRITKKNCTELFTLGTLYENELLVKKCLKWASKHKEFGITTILSLVNKKNIPLVHKLATDMNFKKLTAMLTKKMYEFCQED